MSAICYMEHEEHGALPMYNRDEIKANEKNGWVRISVDDYIKKSQERNEKKMEGVVPSEVGAAAPPVLDPAIKQKKYFDYLNGLQVNDLRMMLDAAGEESKGKKDDLIIALMAIEFEEVII